MKIVLTVLLLFVTLLATAQDNKWRAGVSIGYTNNSYQKNINYQSDWQLRNRGGMTAGITAQYDLRDWFGIRTDLVWVQKNYRMYRSMICNDYSYNNSYLQLPVMATFSFGAQKLRGFFNTGVYGGYWIISSADVTLWNNSLEKYYKVSQSGLINSEKDNRFVFGYVGGAGLEYRLAEKISAQLELRYYYDATSQTKQYQRISDHRYNSTFSIQTTVFYHF